MNKAEIELDNWKRNTAMGLAAIVTIAVSRMVAG
jgi:hypothetical protein